MMIFIHGGVPGVTPYVSGPHIWGGVVQRLPQATAIEVSSQTVDAMTQQVKHRLEPGKGILHMEFTPRGREVWLSARDDNKVVIHDARTYEKLGEIEAQAPSGIFFTARAHRTGL